MRSAPWQARLLEAIDDMTRQTMAEELAAMFDRRAHRYSTNEMIAALQAQIKILEESED